MHRSSQSLGSNRNQAFFTENFVDDINSNSVHKENIAPYDYTSKYKKLHSTNVMNVPSNLDSINTQPNLMHQHRAVLSDVTLQVSNKLNSVPSNSTFKSSGSSVSSFATNSTGGNNNNLSKQLNNSYNIDEITNVNENENDTSVLDENNFRNELDSSSVISDDEKEQQTNEYSSIEPDDNNDNLMSPIKPLHNEETEMIVNQAYDKYYRNTPDLMDEDTYDVVMVAELSNDIFDYLKKLEFKYKPNPNYMHYQKELRWSYRRILLDWIVEVHNRFQLLPETLYLTVNIIDRFLSKKSVLLNKFQLVGAAALFIAAKYEEINCPTLKDILYMLNNANTKEEIIDAERYIIDSLDFEIGCPGPMSFLRRISKADDYEYEIRTLAKYLLESTIMDSRLVAALPSWLAAGSYFLSKVILGYNTWSLKHIYYSGYAQEQILPLATIILENCRDASHYHKVILKKYSSRRQHNSAQLVARWIGSAEKKIESDSPNRYDGEEYER